MNMVSDFCFPRFCRVLCFSRFGASSLLWLSVMVLAFPLSSCGGGSSGGYAAYSEEESGEGADESGEEADEDKGSNGTNKVNEPRNHLPGTSFMPKGFMQAELVIESTSFALQLTCQSTYYGAECFGGEAVFSSVSLINSAGDSGQWEQHTHLSGSWEQMGELNSFNCVNGLYIESVWGSPVDIQLSGLSFDILGRTDNPSQTDSTIVLYGTVASGELTIEGMDEPAILGASVRLTYTIAPGYINGSTHGTYTP